MKIHLYGHQIKKERLTLRKCIEIIFIMINDNVTKVTSFFAYKQIE